MGMGAHQVKLAFVTAAIDAGYLAQIDAKEADLVRELMARDDTGALVISDAGQMLGYAVIGVDLDEMVTVYAARAVKSMMAKAAMIGIFGAAQVFGKPVRVHTEKVRAMARMMGANIAVAADDMDGVPMGIFAHGK